VPGQRRVLNHAFHVQIFDADKAKSVFPS
jgi:hypothetical protein